MSQTDKVIQEMSASSYYGYKWFQKLFSSRVYVVFHLLLLHLDLVFVKTVIHLKSYLLHLKTRYRLNHFSLRPDLCFY